MNIEDLFHDSQDVYIGCGDTAPEAVCRAALRTARDHSTSN